MTEDATPWTGYRIEAGRVDDEQTRAQLVELVRRHDQSENDVMWIEYIPATPTFGTSDAPVALRFARVQRDDAGRPILMMDRTAVVDLVEVDLRGDLPPCWIPGA